MNYRIRFCGMTLLIAMVLMLFPQCPALAMTGPDEGKTLAVTSSVSSSSAPAVEQKGTEKKPWYKSRAAKYTAGSAGAGAIVGGLIGGGKGAAAGAIVGGGAGYLYHRKTRN